MWDVSCKSEADAEVDAEADQLMSWSLMLTLTLTLMLGWCFAVLSQLYDHLVIAVLGTVKKIKLS